MNLEQLLAELDQITDPVERERRQNEIMRQILGSPARSAVGMINPTTEAVADMSPTVENAQKLDDLDRLRFEAGLAERVQKASRPSALTDEELDYILQTDFTNKFGKEQFEQEAEGRKKGTLSVPGMTRLAGQNVSGAKEAVIAGPVAIAGLLSKGIEAITGLPPLKNTEGETVLSSDDILETAAKMVEDIQLSTGISESRNIPESIANIAGGLISLPGTGPTSRIGNIVEYATPLIVGSGNKRVIANFATSFLAEQALREVADDQTNEYQTLLDMARSDTGLRSMVFDKEDHAYPNAASNILTGLGIFTAGSLVTPMALNAMKKIRPQKPPKTIMLRDVDPHAPKNLKSIETAKDLYKTYIVDEKTVLADLLKRAGAPNYDQVVKMIDQDTQTSATMKVNEAMKTGIFRTLAGTFKVDVTPEQLFDAYKRLPAATQKDADMYMKYHDLIDDMKIRIKKNYKVADSQRQIADAQRYINAIEIRSPIVRDLKKQYSHIVRETRNFLGSGQGALLSPKALMDLSVHRSNWVPIDTIGINPTGNFFERVVDAGSDVTQRQLDSFYQQKRSYKNITDINLRGDSFAVLHDYVRNALKAKMENEVRLAYYRSMRGSIHGGETIRQKRKSDAGLVSSDRNVSIYERGRRKQFVSSRLQADLLRFDPYNPKFPTAYALRRGFEHAVTGAASITFAPTTAIRDALAGNVFAPPGVKGPGGPIDVTGAVVKQNWAKMQRAAAQILASDMEIPWLDPPQRQRLAQQASSAYMNSMYHLANEAGGFDASLMKSNIQAGKTVFSEMARSAKDLADKMPIARQLGRSAGLMIQGWKSFYDTIQEAPRYSTFERNVKAGMSPEQASKEARRITGDTMRSGRVYSPQGKRIEADAVNKAATVPLTMGVAKAIEAIRESTPYTNPMIQGMRRLGQRIIDNPVETNLRAWAYVGLPALVAQGWNEMLGEEYNRYAFEGRTSRDIAMNLYVGIPGMRPEEGLNIPIAHELMAWKGPWETSLYALQKGANGEEINYILQHMAATILENSAMIGAPQVATVPMAAAGMNPPDSINPFSWNIYNLREDNAGLLPRNVEEMFRTAFGGTSGLVLDTAAATWEGGPEAFYKELSHGIAKRLPVVGPTLTGTKTFVSNYNPLSERVWEKKKAIEEFVKIYDEHLDPRREGRLKIRPDSATDLVEDSDAQTVHRFAPLPTPAPTNPIAIEFGGLIKDALDSNEEGWKGLDNRGSTLAKQVRLLRSYHAGKADKFKEWQETYGDAEQRYQAAMKKAAGNEDAEKKVESTIGQEVKTNRLVTQMKLDLGKREDVAKLISRLEEERILINKQALKFIEEIEDRVTKDLQARGMLQPGAKFDVEKHLGPLMPNGLLVGN